MYYFYLIRTGKLDDSWPIITSLQSGQTPFSSSSSSERFTIDERDSIEQKIGEKNEYKYKNNNNMNE